MTGLISRLLAILPGRRRARLRVSREHLARFETAQAAGLTKQGPGPSLHDLPPWPGRLTDEDFAPFRSRWDTAQAQASPYEGKRLVAGDMVKWGDVNPWPAPAANAKQALADYMTVCTYLVQALELAKYDGQPARVVMTQDLYDEIRRCSPCKTFIPPFADGVTVLGMPIRIDPTATTPRLEPRA